MRIGDKFFDKNNIITIYDIYHNTVKVKFNNESKYKYLKKSVLNTYRYLIPIGYIESFYIDADGDCDFKDLVFIFFPNQDSTIWTHTFTANPSIIKNRISDNIFNEGFSIYDITMTNLDMSDDWLIYNELDELSKKTHNHLKRISVYTDTSIFDYLKLLQNTLLVYDKVVEETSNIIIDKYCKEFKKRTTTKEILEFMSLFRGIDFALDIAEVEYNFTKVKSDDRFGLVGIDDIDIEDFMCISGVAIRDLIIIPYWYDIDLHSISMEHYLVRDMKTGKLYIFMYNNNGISQSAMNSAFNNKEQNLIMSRMNA
jgi:hypothetical protein